MAGDSGHRAKEPLKYMRRAGSDLSEESTSHIMSVVYFHVLLYLGGISGLIVIVIGNDHDDPSSNSEQDGLHFT